MDHRRLNQFCFNILAEDIWYNEFHEPEAYVPTVRPALLKEMRKYKSR